MPVIDLTHTISPYVPERPGEPAPIVTPAQRVEAEGFGGQRITLTSHTGTHVDAPSCLLPNRPSLDQMPPSAFVGQGVVVNCADLKSGRVISPWRLISHEHNLRRADFVLFHTGWAARWGTPEYFTGYPTLTPETVEQLIQAGLKGVGIDAPSFDAPGAADLPIHRAFLNARVLVYENLCHLDQLDHRPFFFLGPPLKYERSDAAPVRALAVTE